MIDDIRRYTNILKEFDVSDNVKPKSVLVQKDIKFEKLLTAIDKYSSDFLPDMISTKKFLYRGQRISGKPDIFIGASSTFRASVDDESSFTAQIAADILLQVAGISARRSNSIFCVSNLEDASVWGNPYIIFPVNGSSYAWSKAMTNTSVDFYDYPNDEKAYLTLSDYLEEEEENIGFDGIKKIDADFIIEDAGLTFESLQLAAKKFVDLNQIFTTGINEALTMDHDIWFNGKYIAVKTNMIFENGKKALDLLTSHYFGVR